jgi:hypothetical protein
MDNIPKEIKNIILNYKDELEVSYKKQKLIREINYLKIKLFYKDYYCIIKEINNNILIEVCNLCGNFIGLRNVNKKNWEKLICNCKYDE